MGKWEWGATWGRIAYITILLERQISTLKVFGSSTGKLLLKKQSMQPLFENRVGFQVLGKNWFLVVVTSSNMAWLTIGNECIAGIV